MDANDLIDAPEFPLVPLGDLEPKAPVWLIRGILEADTLAMAFGDPGCWKTFMALDMSLSIGTGIDFHGHKVRQGPVVYLCGEGHNGIARRRQAWEIRHQTWLKEEDAPVFISQGPAQLADSVNAHTVAMAVNRIAHEHGPPLLVVLDTLARNFGPGDENSTADMTAFIQAADMIRSRWHSTVLLVHHTGHGQKDRARGAMALKAALDCELRMEKDGDDLVRMDATKMKDGAPPEPMAFKLREVELPLKDEDGNPVTSAVLDRTDYTPPAQVSAPQGKWQRLALEGLQAVTDRHRANLEKAGKDPDTAMVTLDDWRSECSGAGIQRQRWYEAKTKLIEKGLVSVSQGFVWLSCPE